MFKVQVQTMSGEWKDSGKLSEFIDGTWKTKEFPTESAARAAAIAAYPDHYPEHSDNATFRIVRCNEGNKMSYLELAHRFEKESVNAMRQGQRELAWHLAHRAEKVWDDYYAKEHRATMHRTGENFAAGV